MTKVIIADGKCRNTASAADTFFACDYRNFCRKADVVDDLCVGSNCIICRYINYITCVSCCCSNRREIIRVRECIIFTCISEFFKFSFYCIYLILRVCFGRTVEKTGLKCFRSWCNNARFLRQAHKIFLLVFLYPFGLLCDCRGSGHHVQ